MVETQLTVSGDASKPISVYCIQDVDNFFNSSVGIKINISDFTYDYNLNFIGNTKSFEYHESEYSSWKFEYGQNLIGLRGYTGVSNTIQGNISSTSTNLTGSFNGIYMLFATAFNYNPVPAPEPFPSLG